MANNFLGDRFKKIMEDNDLNFSSMARKCGLDESQIRHVIKGQTKDPRSSVLGAVAKTFSNVNPYWLLTGEGSYKATEIDSTHKPISHISDSEDCASCYLKQGKIEQLEIFNESLIKRNEKYIQEIGRLKGITEVAQKKFFKIEEDEKDNDI
jgi:transcriptional regulator with XRE-family HTH domain